jgi:hypothetical protein
MLFYLEHAIQDASTTRAGDRRLVSKRMLYVEMDAFGTPRHLNYAQYLDYRALRSDEPDLATIIGRPECAWIGPRGAGDRSLKFPATRRLRCALAVACCRQETCCTNVGG